ncbi:hypothetical protein [Erythrobacter crassostreae]|uniref:Uncharacterized protein n=1 Tax=Erythrobacter crassostreae TaxID=2828328 RepID=A0A9X1F2Q6_9SPHN|nr:hypothetical protein [Erythrobacter crassostrea]MBV7259079.1 hypothetical protein [Erythrobacter crassostrea]
MGHLRTGKVGYYKICIADAFFRVFADVRFAGGSANTAYYNLQTVRAFTLPHFRFASPRASLPDPRLATLLPDAALRA